ncbi:MAG: pyridoxamine 5'-phosphate oxidase family protein, partial [Actinomycetota bacterium]
MSDDEVMAFILGQRRVQVGTVNADGTPHLVPLSYVLIDGRITLWTDPRSQKVVNLRRDPRITCLVEDGTHFAEFRAAQLSGRAELAGDLETSARVGLALYERSGAPMTDELRASATALAPERVAVTVHPERVISWDHRKLAGVRPSQIGT